MLARVIFALFGLVAGGFGAWMTIQGANAVVEAEQSATWPTATGKIIGSRVEVTISHGRHSSSHNYTPLISYSYTAAERIYNGTMIAPGRNWGSRSAYATVGAFPPGKSATIHYSPANPAQAVLDPGLHGYNFGKLLVGMLILTFASLFLLVGVNAVPDPKGRSGGLTFRSGSWAAKLIFIPIIALVLEVVALIWLS